MDRAVIRWNEIEEERVRWWGREWRRDLGRRRSGAVAAAVVVADAMDGTSGCGGFREPVAEQKKNQE